MSWPTRPCPITNQAKLKAFFGTKRPSTCMSSLLAVCWPIMRPFVPWADNSGPHPGLNGQRLGSLVGHTNGLGSRGPGVLSVKLVRPRAGKQKRKVSAAHARGPAALCTISISPTKLLSRPGSMPPNSPWSFVVGVEDTPSRRSVSSPSRASHRGQGGPLRSSRDCGQAGTPLIVPL
jgi:hypothetical protein